MYCLVPSPLPSETALTLEEKNLDISNRWQLALNVGKPDLPQLTGE